MIQSNRINKYLAIAKRYGWVFVKFAVLTGFTLVLLERLLKTTQILQWIKLVDLSVYLSLLFGAISIVFKYTKDRISTATKAIQVNTARRIDQERSQEILERRCEGIEAA